MTAGQRNCFLAIQECLDRYRMQDVLYALRQHLIIQSAELPEGSLPQRACMDACEELDLVEKSLSDGA